MANVENNIERWVPVLGYEGIYEISDRGNIMSLNYNKTNKRRKLKLGNHNGGYLCVGLSKDKKVKTHLVHRLVLASFSDGHKKGLEGNHKDGNKKNNALSNLEWCTPKQNMAHAIATKLKVKKGAARGEKCHSAILNEERVREIRLSTLPVKDLAAKYSVSIHTIYHILSRRKWKHVV